MPQTMNGIGTWYYGKKNVQKYQGVCRACNRLTNLTSYDTRLYFVFFMIPIFPLGRKRIIEECAICTRHQAMPMNIWQEAHRRTEQLIEQYRAAPSDKERVQE